ncbi:MAG: carbohydrate kinase family protein [Aggregatilineales bacterium]
MELNAARPPDKRQLDVLIPGDYFCDIIFTGLQTFPALGAEIYAHQVNVVPGGGALNSSIALRRLGVNVGWLGRLGNDFFSQFIGDLLRVENVDMSLVKQLDGPLQRVTVALSYPADRAFVTYVDPTDSVVDRVFEVLDHVEFRHLHFPGLVLDGHVAALLDVCCGRGISVSMDCQHRLETLAQPHVREIMSRVSIFMPNTDEALRITETDNLDRAMAALSEIVPYVVIKQGGYGARSRYQGVDYESPALPVEVLDTTGAGDVFNAGFLAAYLKGHDPVECLRWGNFCGSLSVRGVGGTSSAPTLAALTEWLVQEKI